MRGKNPLIFILFFSVIFTAASALGANETGKPQDPSSASPAKLGADVNSLVFTGTIEKISDQAVLVTPKATYLLTGGNFDGIVGMKVNIIGRIIQDDAIDKIVVARAQLAGY